MNILILKQPELDKKCNEKDCNICLGRNVDIVEIFENCNWMKKLEHPCPDYDVKKIFCAGDGKKLQEYLQSHAEDTPEVTRSLFLFSESSEFKVAVIEQPWLATF